MGWQALQVTDFKDPHYPAVCLITRRSQVQILPPLPTKRRTYEGNLQTEFARL